MTEGALKAYGNRCKNICITDLFLIQKLFGGIRQLLSQSLIRVEDLQVVGEGGNGAVNFGNCLLQKVEQAQFVGKDEEDAEGGEVADDETVGGIEGGAEGAVVGQFGTENFFIDYPAKEDAHERAADGHDEFGYEEVEEVEEVHVEDFHVSPITK